MVAGRQHPLLLDDFLGAGEPAAPLLLPRREIARLGQPLLVPHALDNPIELRPLRQPLGIKLRHRGERPVEKAQGPVGIELRRAGRHPIGELALRFDITGKLGARFLEVLDIEREPGNGAGRKRDIDDPQHAPLTVDDRRLHPRNRAAERLRLPRPRERTVFALRVDQLGAALDHCRGIAPFDGMHESAVDQAELEIRPAVPHREGRRFNHLGQRVDRSFGLPQPKCELGSLLLDSADIDEPQQQRPRRLPWRCRASANIVHSTDAVRADVARYPRRRRSGNLDHRAQGLEILGDNPAAALGKIAKRLRRSLKSELTHQTLVDLDQPIAPDCERPRRRELEQTGIGPSRVEHLLGQAIPASGNDGDGRGEPEPQQRQRGNCQTPNAERPHGRAQTP